VRNVCGEDPLSVATGCAGVFNSDQMLTLRLQMAPSDWVAITSHGGASDYRPARFRCEGDPELDFQIGVRRKRSGGAAQKPGLKLDFNHLVAGGRWQGLKKTSLENGGGTTEGIVSEYLAWRMMIRSAAYASRATLVRLYVNDQFVGVYLNLEQVDRRFLKARLGEDVGWLFKKSGSEGDGYKTNTTTPNPYAEQLCFWGAGATCSAPDASELKVLLPQRLELEQFMRVSGVNALLGNADGPLATDNNYYWYDRASGPRLYFPWDLDGVRHNPGPLFPPVAEDSSPFRALLFTHWENDYDLLLTNLLQGPLAVTGMEGELDRVSHLAAEALATDPVLGGQPLDAALTTWSAWWRARHAQTTEELRQHAP
jgi:hypothetical protein